MADHSRLLAGGQTHPEAEARIWYPGIEALRLLAAVAVVIETLLVPPDEQFAQLRLRHNPGPRQLGCRRLFPPLWIPPGGLLLVDPPPDGSRFYVRRFFRIAPAYYVCVGILALFFAQHALLFSPAGFKQLLALLTFTQWLWPTTSTNLNVNGSLWTLTIEMILYLTLPLLAWLISKRPVLASLGLAGLGIGYRLIVVFHGQWLQQWRFPAGFDSGLARLYLSRQFIGILPIFVLGIALRWASQRGHLDRVMRSLRWGSPRPNFFVLLALLVPSLVYLRGVQTGSSYTNWFQFTFFDYGVCLLAVPALLYAARPISSSLPRHMIPAVWMGERSYGLYLWHFPVILSIYGIGTAGNPADLHHLPLKIAAIFVISIALAWGSYSLVELPAEYGRKAARRVGSREARRAWVVPIGRVASASGAADVQAVEPVRQPGDSNQTG